MTVRRLPSSLAWLAALVMLSIIAATVAGIAIYVETRMAARTQASAISHGYAARGKIAIAAKNCQACHVIPGVAGPAGAVGPDLTDVATRAMIAGRFRNDPDTMIRWLMHPQVMSPGSGMPEQGLSETEARNIAAYLYSNR